MYPVTINQNLEQMLETKHQQVIEHFNSQTGSFSLPEDSKNYRGELEEKISNIKNSIRQAQSEGIKEKCFRVQKRLMAFSEERMKNEIKLQDDTKIDYIKETLKHFSA